MKPCVAILIAPQTSYEREIIAGISEFLAERGTWRARYNPWRKEHDLGILKQADAAIVAADRSLHDDMAAWGRPIVSVTAELADPQWAGNVICDDRGVGKLVAEDLRARAFEHYAVVRQGQMHSHQRCEGFSTALAELGATADIFDTNWGFSQGDPAHPLGSDEELTRFLLAQPKPVAVFATNDVIGNRVVDLAVEAGLAVPEAVAVVGVDNDPALCLLSRPPLSSVDLSSRHIGYAAAEIMQDVLDGKVRRDRTVVVPPRRLVHRQSSNTLAVADAEVAAALTFIRKNATRGIDVEAVLRRLPISRRSLELRFRHLLRRTPRQEILRVQIEEAKALLATTDRQVGDVAAIAGFSSQTRFGIVFRQHVGETPSAYRKRYKLGH